jgi:tetratricopeptide (TPR) repeat protein
LKQSGHSIFSYYLLEGLRGANGESIDKLGHVTPDTLGDYVFEKVVENVPNQRPIKKVIMTGNIVLANHRELLRNTQFDSQVDPILKIETKEKPTVTKLRRKKKPGIKPDRWKFLNYWRQKGNRLYKQGQYQKAIEAYTMILRSPSKDSLVLNNMGNCLAYLSRFEAAIEYYDKALKISPYDDYILGNKGWALDGLGKHDEAIEYYDKAVKINPINDMALAYKGAALGGLGKHDEAIEYYDKALKINPENELALTYTGLSLTILGKHDEAIEYYDKALKINPENELALDNKNQALVKTPQWKRFFRLRKKPTS